MLSYLNLNAAGVDIGATEIHIAVPGDRDPQRRMQIFREGREAPHHTSIAGCAPNWALPRQLRPRPTN
jgi:hypothetical protein